MTESKGTAVPSRLMMLAGMEESSRNIVNRAVQNMDANTDT
ncbi:hypothetical protein [Desulfovibrio sp. G11]|nr:hypothetical protein [Desulfovibrio sp. G11]